MLPARRSEKIGELAKALSLAQAEFEEIKKDKEVNVKMKNGGTYSYKYAEMSSVIAATRGPMAKHELAFTQDIENHENHLWMVTTLMHSSDQFISNFVPIITGPEDDKQEVAGAVTFARRYGLQNALGVISEDDNDGNGANREEKKGGNKKPPADPPAKPASSPPPASPAAKPAKPSAPKPGAAPARKPDPFVFTGEPLSAVQKMELSKYVFIGGKFKGQRLGDVLEADAWQYLQDLQAEYPASGEKVPPAPVLDIMNRIKAYWTK